jgi:hypothetical protein
MAFILAGSRMSGRFHTLQLPNPRFQENKIANLDDPVSQAGLGPRNKLPARDRWIANLTDVATLKGWPYTTEIQQTSHLDATAWIPGLLSYLTC